MKLVLTLLLLSSSCWAQDAKVLALSPVDAQQAQAKYQALQRAQKEWDSFQERIKQDYLIVPKGDPEAGNVMPSFFRLPSCTTSSTATINLDNGMTSTIPGEKEAISECEENANKVDKKNEREHPTMYQRVGWEQGFTFTKDFKFLVPAAAKELKYNYSPYNSYFLGVAQ